MLVILEVKCTGSIALSGVVPQNSILFPTLFDIYMKLLGEVRRDVG